MILVVVVVVVFAAKSPAAIVAACLVADADVDVVDADMNSSVADLVADALLADDLVADTLVADAVAVVAADADDVASVVLSLEDIDHIVLDQSNAPDVDTSLDDFQGTAGIVETPRHLFGLECLEGIVLFPDVPVYIGRPLPNILCVVDAEDALDDLDLEALAVVFWIDVVVVGTGDIDNPDPDRQNAIHHRLFHPNIPGDICNLLPRDPPANVLLQTMEVDPLLSPTDIVVDSVQCSLLIVSDFLV